MNGLSFRGMWLGKKVTETHINLLKVKMVWGTQQKFRTPLEKSSILPDMQNDSSGLSDKGGWHPLQGAEWSCVESFTEMPQ